MDQGAHIPGRCTPGVHNFCLGTSKSYPKFQVLFQGDTFCPLRHLRAKARLPLCFLDLNVKWRVKKYIKYELWSMKLTQYGVMKLWSYGQRLWARGLGSMGLTPNPPNSRLSKIMTPTCPLSMNTRGKRGCFYIGYKWGISLFKRCCS